MASSAGRGSPRHNSPDLDPAAGLRVARHASGHSGSGRGRRGPCARPALARVLLALAVLSTGAARTHGQPVEYHRPVEAAPREKDIGGGYVTPSVQRPLPRAPWREVTDVVVLAAALAASAWIVLKRRNRDWLVALTIGSLIYFGFYRQGCVCPIGAIQNVTVALLDPQHTASYLVIVIFFLPLAAAVLFGRVFCGGVCPLGAIQDLVLLRPLHVPRVLDKLLGLLKWAYLALAIWFAARPAVERDFVICRFDPFVGFFRFAGPAYLLLIGGGLLLLGLFVGRPYCRYLCPYGVLLSLLSRISWWNVSVTPDKELDCGLCAAACPFGAIENLRAVRATCLFCARCFHHCPRHRVRDSGGRAPLSLAAADAPAGRSLPGEERAPAPAP